MQAARLWRIANVRVPVIAAVEGRAHIHSDSALLASVIVAAEGAWRALENWPICTCRHRK